MWKIIINAFAVAILSSTLLGATKSECRQYEKKFSHYVETFNSNSEDTKKYPLIMVKSYLDSILTECEGVIDTSFYKKQKPIIKKMWNNYIPNVVTPTPTAQCIIQKL